MGSRFVDLNPGEWRTLEKFWNVAASLSFQKPPGARIRVRYGIGNVSWTSIAETLDGLNPKTIEISAVSLLGARVQVWVNSKVQLQYTFSLTAQGRHRET